MTQQAIFQLNHVSKKYGDNCALSPLSLRIAKGETVAFIGPSGAGKSTLLNILANIVVPDNGGVLLDGKPARHYASRKQRAGKVGIIRQQFDLVGPLPVIHNVLAGRLGNWGWFKSLLSLIAPQDRELAIEALERVGLIEKLYEKTSNLSGGEQQRVALARLLVQHPEAILADEPVASLDPSRAEDILSMLVRLVHEEHQTLIAILHSVDLAKKYFSRIVAFREGKLFFDLPTDEVSDRQLSDLYELMEMKENAETVPAP